MQPYLYYLAGILALALPAGPLSRRRFQLVSLRELTDSPRHRLGWIHAVNAIDLARAWGGLALLQQAFHAVEPAAGLTAIGVLTLTVAALAGLGLQQAFQPGDADDLVAPAAYATGLLFALIPPTVALFVLPLGLAAAFGFRSLGSGFTVAAFAAVGLGWFLHASPLIAAATGLILFTPVLTAGVLQRRLVLTVRRTPAQRHGAFRDIPVVRRAC